MEEGGGASMNGGFLRNTFIVGYKKERLYNFFLKVKYFCWLKNLSKGCLFKKNEKEDDILAGVMSGVNHKHQAILTGAI